MDLETADNLVESLEAIVTWTIKKKEEGVDVRMVEQYLPDMLEFLLRCETAYITYKLLKKDDPENVKEQKVKIDKLMKDLSKISTESQPDEDFFDGQVVKIVDNTYTNIHEKFEKDQESDRIWKEEEAEKKRV
jgi:hypothetical protein